MEFPSLIKVRQQFGPGKLENIEGHLQSELAACGVTIERGSRMAIAVGSRGIAQIAPIIRETVRWVREHKAEPFIVPAMGSHGGATAEGQLKVLAGYGITEDHVGAPVRSSMNVVELPQDDLETRVYFDEHAFRADGTIVVNRIKAHTSFHGRYESGLMKMIAIGLGKHAQALALHRLGVHGLREIMPKVARQILRHGNVILGVAIVENAYDEVLLIRALPAASIPEQEPALLDTARANMPNLPVTDLDILIIDEMGKNISGVGLDTNVIGRLRFRGQPEPDRPNFKIITVHDLTDESHGNAIGVGLADITTRRLFEKIDFQATYTNVVTSTFLERGKIPIVTETDREAVELALRASAASDPTAARIVRIANTSRLDALQVSPTVLREIEGRPGIQVLGPAGEPFDSKDALKPW